MARRWLRVLIFVPAGIVIAFLVGRVAWMAVFREPVHGDGRAIPSVVGVEPGREWAEAVGRARGVVRDAMVGRNVPGVSVAVGAGGALVWAEGFGYEDLEPRAGVTAETPFRMGTASTVLTSAAVGLLVEGGRMRWEEEIQTYVPQYPEKQWPVTVRELMAHTAGLGTDEGEQSALMRQRCGEAAEGVAGFAKDELLFEPGTEFRQSHYGWILVSAAVEAAGGRPLLGLLRERVFDGLGMAGTGAESMQEENPEHVGEEEEDPPPMRFLADYVLRPLGVVEERVRPVRRAATVYWPGFGKEGLIRYGLHVMPGRNLSCYSGAMQFLSTPADLVRFGLAMGGGKLLKAETVRALWTAQKLKSGEETGNGLGWELDTVRLAGVERRAVGGDGELLGRRLMTMLVLEESGIVVVVMANQPEADTAGLAARVAEVFAGGGATGRR